MKNQNKQNQMPSEEYKAEILKKSGIVTNKGGKAYLRPEFYQRMEELVSLFAEEGMTVEDYLDNVLAQHFVQFGDAIDASFEQHARYHQRRERGRLAKKRQKAEEMLPTTRNFSPSSLNARKSKPGSVSILTARHISR